MAELKTKKNNTSVTAFIAAIEDKQKRADCKTLHKMMREATGSRAKMYGPSIVGYGTYKYTYANGKPGEFCITGFSPRKQNLVLYIMPGFSGSAGLLKRLGKHKVGKSCLYLTRLDKVDLTVLQQLIEKSVEVMRKKYP